MTCDIVIRSYYKDFTWLQQCLRSIERYCTSFRRTIVVIPKSSWRRLPSTGFSNYQITLISCPDYPDDYLGQQVTKLYSDTFTDAEYICHVDSDCVFMRPCQPKQLFHKGKIQIAMTSYTTLSSSNPWKSATERFFKRPIPYDFMRRQPLVYPHGLYQKLRDYSRLHHRVKLDEYVTTQPPRGFSEFNALGAYAFYFDRAQFSWIDTVADTPGKPFCKWYWSWGGMQPQIKREIEGLLKSDG